MIITKLELENWMRIRQLSLEFGKGINIIYGRNEIGKSSIIEAVRRAFVGDAASGKAEYKRLKPWDAGSGVRAAVKLYFTTSDRKEYSIDKTFPKGEARLFSGNIPLAEEAGKTQKKIFDILGISEKNAGLFDLLFIDQGRTLNIFDKKTNPLNEDNRAYLKDIIKETALKSFQELQDRLNRERDQLFTNPTMKKFKSGRNAPHYIRQLEREYELSRRLEELERQADEFSQQLLELAMLERKTKRFLDSRQKKESELEQVKAKAGALEEKEKKELELKPLFQDHRRYLDIESQLKEIQEDLPQLYALRNERLRQLETRLNQLKTEENQKRRYLSDLRLKKKETEGFEEAKRQYEDIEKEHRELENLDGLRKENRKRLPFLLAANRRKLREAIEAAETNIKRLKEKHEQLESLEKQLTETPKITDEDVAQMRTLSSEAVNLKMRIEAAQSEIQMDFKLTPYSDNEVRFNLSRDGGETENFNATEPVKIKQFRQLFFEYPETFTIDLQGSPADVDMESLNKDYREKQAILTDRLRQFQVRSVEELESRFQEYRELHNKQKGLSEQLRGMPGLNTLEAEKADTTAEFEQLAGDVSRYCSPEQTIESVDALQFTDNLLQLPHRELRDQLTRLKSDYDNHDAQREKILNRRTPQAFEDQYNRKKKAFIDLRETLHQMEPKEIKDVRQEHLDNATDQLNDTTREMNAVENEKQLLESMETVPATQQELPPEKANTLNEYNAQQIREAVNQKITIREKLENQRDDILKDRSTEEYQNSIRHHEEELKHLAHSISAMEPTEITASEKATHRINFLETEIKELYGDIEKNNLQKAALDDRLKDHSRLTEDSNKATFEHRRLLEDIKSEITDIYGLKLLLNVIEEEKEKAQGQVFKPVQDRVTERFSRLIPHRYRVDMSENMDIDVAASTPDGTFRNGIAEDLSFGTREQLSFLLRLAIAEQLSQKEPQLMILDDSFVNTDANRLPLLMEMMEEAAHQIQFLVFTCKESDYTHYKTRTHAINLEYLLID